MKTCTWPGCDRPLKARGLCGRGYTRMHKLGWLDHDTAPASTRPEICTWPGCDSPNVGGGLCSKGWQRVHRGGWIDHDTPRKPRLETCTWPGCDAPHGAKGLCDKGYDRVYMHGWIDHDTPAVERVRGKCTWPGCDAPHAARGLCAKGYYRITTSGWIDHDTPGDSRLPATGRLARSICTWPGCDRLNVAEGMCERGYKRVRYLGWIDHDTPGADGPRPSTIVYLVHHQEMNAVKIGIGGAERQRQHTSRGWEIIDTWDFSTPDEARKAERRVLDLWDGWTGYLTAEQMPKRGWTETVDARVYDAAAVRLALAG